MAFDPFNYPDLFDSHCHLNSERFDNDRDAVVKRAQENGVTRIVDVVIDLKSARQSLELSEKYPEVVYSTIGIHPELLIPGAGMFNREIDKSRILEKTRELRAYLEANKNGFAMIGECGLDYYWLVQNVREQDEYERRVELQKFLFEEQVKLAVEFQLPLTIHHREATGDCMDIIRKYPEVKGVFHSFTGDLRQAKEILEMEFKLGINGIVTFQNAENIRAVVRKITAGKDIKDIKDLYKIGILLETDSPYLAPQIKRGERNEPGNVVEIFRFLKSELS